MKAKEFFFCDRATAVNYQSRWHHWVPTDDPDKVLLVAAMDDGEAIEFAKKPGVEPLEILSTLPVTPGQNQALRRFGVVPGERAYEALKKVAQSAPLHRPSTGWS